MDIENNRITKVYDTAGRFIAEDDADEVKLPCRFTLGSAGYDFYSPEQFEIKPGESIKFNTHVIADINPGWVLLLFPRSSLGMKGIRIANTVGVVDSDYKLPIFCKLVNDGEESIVINEGDRFMQGIFVNYGVVLDENVVNVERTGGMGSTGK